MNTGQTSAKRFYCYPANTVEGPFELIELAGLLRANHITADTPVLREGESDDKWVPFKQRSEFHLANEIHQDAINLHAKEKAEAQESPFTFRRLKVLFFLFPVFFLLLAWRVFVFIMRMQAHQAPDPSDLTDPSGSN